MPFPKTTEQLTTLISDYLSSTVGQTLLKENITSREHLHSILLSQEDFIWHHASTLIDEYNEIEAAYLSTKRQIDKISLRESAYYKFVSVASPMALFVLVLAFVIYVIASFINGWSAQFQSIYSFFVSNDLAFYILIGTISFTIIPYPFIEYRRNKRIERIKQQQTIELKLEEKMVRLNSAKELIPSQIIEKVLNLQAIEALNDFKETSYSYDLPERLFAPGLAEVQNAAYEISTEYRDRLIGIMNGMSGGSVGISGVRGVGKSTLIRSICKSHDMKLSTRPALTVLTAAPVEYAGRDFILHLFSQICWQVLKLNEVAFELKPRRTFRQPPFFTTLRAILSKAARKKMIEKYFRDHSLFGEGDLDTISKASIDHLKKIKFQQSYTSGWSGSLNFRIAEVGYEQSASYEEVSMTLPEIIDAYRNFMGLITSKYDVIIGIDELDKISTPEGAQRFVNEIKSVFGIDRCFYLVSISEDAMSNFERRGLPLRDAFDSSFDFVLHITDSSSANSIRLLKRRVLDLPEPFADFLHVFSGGLPRDLIRVCRDLVFISKTKTSSRRLEDIMVLLAQEDLTSKLSAYLIEFRKLGNNNLSYEVITYMNNIAKKLLSVKNAVGLLDLEDLLKGFQVEKPDNDILKHDSLRLLKLEFAAYICYLAHVLFFFADRSESNSVKKIVNELASARQLIGTNPVLIGRVLSDLRTKHTAIQLT